MKNQGAHSQVGEMQRMSKEKMVWRSGWLLLLLTLYFAGETVAPRMVAAHDSVPHGVTVTDLVGFDQRLNESIPQALTFRDETGRKVRLGDYLGDKPVILSLSYFECETLCPLVRHGLVESLKPMTFSAGEQFEVVLVSIDPEETVTNAQNVKAETVAEYDRNGSARGWHFLTGDHETIDTLADAIGFRYAYDGALDEYAHPSGIVILTEDGRIARYFFGIEYTPQDVRLGLVEASQNRIGTAIDQLLLLCYHYDPTTGKYSLLIMNVLRAAGVVTVALLGLLIFVMWRKESRRASHGAAMPG
jgi:protein SCO1/2